VEFTTLDVQTADGQVLKLGAYPGSGAQLAVLVLHGLYSHMGWYRPLAEALVERGAAVYLLDRRGAGLSGGLAGHIDSWRQIVDDLQRVVARIRSLHPGAPVCALGISLGAAMTVATSLVHEDAFHRHALMSPGLAPSVQLPFMRRIGVVYSALARPHVLYELPFTVEQLCEMSELRESLWNDPLRTRAITSRFLLEIFRLQRYVRQHIDRLRAPLLALIAGADAMIDNEAVLAVLNRARRVPVRVEIFPQAQHVLTASVPLPELAGRIWHWFSAAEESLEQRVVIQLVPPSPAAEASPA
jgi:alpha-beta hydrolase superfamily lysophospholipase